MKKMYFVALIMCIFSSVLAEESKSIQPLFFTKNLMSETYEIRLEQKEGAYKIHAEATQPFTLCIIYLKAEKEGFTVISSSQAKFEKHASFEVPKQTFNGYIVIALVPNVKLNLVPCGEKVTLNSLKKILPHTSVNGQLRLVGHMKVFQITPIVERFEHVQIYPEKKEKKHE